MGALYKRKKGSGNQNKEKHRFMKAKHYKKDIDIRYNDMKPQNLAKLQNQPIDEDLPGLGQWYCVACSRYFQSKVAIDDHTKTKIHRRSLKDLKEIPTTIDQQEEYGKW